MTKGALKPTIKKVYLWIKQLWSRVKEDVKSFKKFGINNALNGNEDHMKRTMMTMKRKKKKRKFR